MPPPRMVVQCPLEQFQEQQAHAPLAGFAQALLASISPLIETGPHTAGVGFEWLCPQQLLQTFWQCPAGVSQVPHLGRYAS